MVRFVLKPGPLPVWASPGLPGSGRSGPARPPRAAMTSMGADTDWSVHACVSIPPPRPAGCGPASRRMARGPLIWARPRPATLGTCAVGDTRLLAGPSVRQALGGRWGRWGPCGRPVGGSGTHGGGRRPPHRTPRAPGLSAGPATARRGLPRVPSWVVDELQLGHLPGVRALTWPHLPPPLQTFRGRGLHQVSALECLVGRGAQV